jgi:Holliday junction resolvase RusA-like endonuclease
MIRLDIPPMAKPRQTQSDRWKQRPVVVRYRAWCDEVRRQMDGRALPEAFWATFHLPIAKSRRGLAEGDRHTQKPDADNLLKALMDALLEDDSGVWDVRATKLWTTGPGCIEIGELQ